MGKMKNELLKQEEENWITEAQEKILNDKKNTIKIMYGDLLTLKDISRANRVYVTMMNSAIYDFQADDVIKLSSVSIKINYGLGQTIVLPLDKIIAVKYVM